MSDSRVATEIIKQLGGFGKLKAMVNAKNMVFDNYSLTFRFSGSRAMNMITIKYNSMDLYDITFAKYSPSKYTSKVIHQIDGIYNDQLIDLFEGTTGLYLSL